MRMVTGGSKATWLLTGVMMISLVLSGCSSQTQVSKELRTVEVQTIGKQKADFSEGISGNIMPVETTKLSFKIDGVIESIYVKEGDVVQKGTPIAKIKPKDYQLALQASKAQYDSAHMSIQKDIPNKLAQAKAQLDLSQVTYDRVKSLYEQGAVSKSELDQVSAKLTVDKSTYQQAQDAYQIASTQLGQAKAAYDLSTDNLKETTLYSPVEGIVLKKLSANGEVQGAGYPVAVVGTLSEVWAEFGVTDSQIGQFKLGQQWPVYVYGIDQARTGIVAEIGAVADEKTRLFTVRLKLDNKDGRMKPGMIAKSNFTQKKDEQILIPFLSVVHLAEGDVVYVYDKMQKIVMQRKVQTGNLIDDRIEVLSGLNIGDQIVTQGQYQVSDKEQVKVND